MLAFFSSKKVLKPLLGRHYFFFWIFGLMYGLSNLVVERFCNWYCIRFQTDLSVCVRFSYWWHSSLKWHSVYDQKTREENANTFYLLLPSIELGTFSLSLIDYALGKVGRFKLFIGKFWVILIFLSHLMFTSFCFHVLVTMVMCHIVWYLCNGWVTRQ